MELDYPVKRQLDNCTGINELINETLITTVLYPPIVNQLN
jgi:hypothetical protein